MKRINCQVQNKQGGMFISFGKNPFRTSLFQLPCLLIFQQQLPEINICEMFISHRCKSQTTSMETQREKLKKKPPEEFSTIDTKPFEI